MTIKTPDLEYFAMVAERRHVGRAAEALGLSQPALSKSLRRLENAVGAKLVQRTPRGVDLTTVGAALFARARALRLTLDDIAREAADLNQGLAGSVRVGTTQGLSGSLMPAACAAMLKDAPGAALKITVGTAEAVDLALSRGESDLVVRPGNPIKYDNFFGEHLFDRAFVVIASARHRLAGRKHVALADLARERWMLSAESPDREALERSFSLNGLPAPIVALDTVSVPFRLDVLPSTDLLSFGPRQSLRGRGPRSELVELAVKGLSRRQQVSVYRRKEAYLPPVGVRFVEILKLKARAIAEEP